MGDLDGPGGLDLETAGVRDVTSAMAAGRVSAVDLVHGYLRSGGDPDQVLAAMDAAYQDSHR